MEGDRKKSEVVGLGWGRVTDVRGGGKVRGIDEETIVRTFHLKIGRRSGGERGSDVRASNIRCYKRAIYRITVLGSG